jgi:hypothetical protein
VQRRVSRIARSINEMRVIEQDPLLQVHRRFRPVHLSEESPFKWAIIMSRKVDETGIEIDPEAATMQHAQVVENLTQAGLDVTILRSTDQSKDKVILLVNASEARLTQEWKRLNAERHEYKNAPEMMLKEEMFEDGQHNHEYFDDLITARPAWHREDPIRGKLSEDDYESKKWESERDLSYADEILCIQRILRASPEPTVGTDSVHDLVVDPSDKLVAIFRGAGLREFRDISSVFDIWDTSHTFH